MQEIGKIYVRRRSTTREASNKVLVVAGRIGDIGKGKRGNRGYKGRGKGDGRGDAGKGKGKKGRDDQRERERAREWNPAAPAALRNKATVTPAGERICFNFNLKGGCTEKEEKGACRRGLHVCAEPGCFGPHSLTNHL